MSDNLKEDVYNVIKNNQNSHDINNISIDTKTIKKFIKSQKKDRKMRKKEIKLLKEISNKLDRIISIGTNDDDF